MYLRVCVLGIVAWSAAVRTAAPHGLGVSTTCEEFERSAYFNPYTVIDSMWKIFYVWANTTETYPIIFSLPAKNRIAKIKTMLEVVEPGLEIEWYRAALLMEPRPGLLVVFLYAGTPGAFRALIRMEQRTKVRPYPLPLFKFADVRLKLVDRYIAMMCCEDFTAYAMARIDDMPDTEQDCARAAQTLNLPLNEGHCYLKINRLADEL